MPANSWLLGLVVLVTIGIVLFSLRNEKIAELFHTHVRDRPRRRVLLATIGFFVTFGVARAIAYTVYRQQPGSIQGPFQYIYVGGTHVHHLVFGILLLLAVGFCWLIEVGSGSRHSSLLASRLVSLLYGVAAALTLDEFALWLHVEEGIYWTRRDLISIDAVLLFGAALLIGMSGRGFLKALGIELWHERKKRKRHKKEARLEHRRRREEEHRKAPV